MKNSGTLSKTICIAMLSVAMLSLSGCNLLFPEEDAAKTDAKPDTAKDNTPEKPATADTSSANDTTPAADTAEAAPKLDLTFPKLDPTVGPGLNKKQKMKSLSLYNDGMKLYREEKYADALEMFQGAIKINPSNLLFRKDAACTLVQLNELDTVEALLKEMTITDDCPRCYVALAEAWEDKCFAGVKKEVRFKSITRPAFEQVKKELAESTWITIVPWRDDSFRLKIDDLPARSEDDSRIVAMLRLKYENTDRSHPRVFLQVIDVDTDIVKNSQLIVTPQEILSIEKDEKVEIIRERIKERIRDGHKMMLGTKWHRIPSSEIPEKYKDKPKLEFEL